MIPLLSGWAQIVLRKGPRASIKMRGESGEPCQVPFHIVHKVSIKCQREPLTLTQAEVVEYSEANHRLIPDPSPICSYVVCRKIQSTLSNAFSASAEKSTKGK